MAKKKKGGKKGLLKFRAARPVFYFVKCPNRKSKTIPDIIHIDRAKIIAAKINETPPNRYVHKQLPIPHFSSYKDTAQTTKIITKDSVEPPIIISIGDAALIISDISPHFLVFGGRNVPTSFRRLIGF